MKFTTIIVFGLLAGINALADDAVVLKEATQYLQTVQCKDASVSLELNSGKFDQDLNRIENMTLLPEPLLRHRDQVLLVKDHTQFLVGYLPMRGIISCRESTFLVELVKLTNQRLWLTGQKPALGKALLKQLNAIVNSNGTSSQLTAILGLDNLRRNEFIKVNHADTQKLATLMASVKKVNAEHQEKVNALAKSKDQKKFREFLEADLKNKNSTVSTLLSSIQSQNLN